MAASTHLTHLCAESIDRIAWFLEGTNINQLEGTGCARLRQLLRRCVTCAKFAVEPFASLPALANELVNVRVLSIAESSLVEGHPIRNPVRVIPSAWSTIQSLKLAYAQSFDIMREPSLRASMPLLRKLTCSNAQSVFDEQWLSHLPPTLTSLKICRASFNPMRIDVLKSQCQIKLAGFGAKLPPYLQLLKTNAMLLVPNNEVTNDDVNWPLTMKTLRLTINADASFPSVLPPYLEWLEIIQPKDKAIRWLSAGQILALPVTLRELHVTSKIRIDLAHPMPPNLEYCDIFVPRDQYKDIIAALPCSLKHLSIASDGSRRVHHDKFTNLTHLSLKNDVPHDLSRASSVVDLLMDASTPQWNFTLPPGLTRLSVLHREPWTTSISESWPSRLVDLNLIDFDFDADVGSIDSAFGLSVWKSLPPSLTRLSVSARHFKDVECMRRLPPGLKAFHITVNRPMSDSNLFSCLPNGIEKLVVHVKCEFVPLDVLDIWRRDAMSCFPTMTYLSFDMSRVTKSPRRSELEPPSLLFDIASAIQSLPITLVALRLTLTPRDNITSEKALHALKQCRIKELHLSNVANIGEHNFAFVPPSVNRLVINSIHLHAPFTTNDLQFLPPGIMDIDIPVQDPLEWKKALTEYYAQSMWQTCWYDENNKPAQSWLRRD